MTYIPRRYQKSEGCWCGDYINVESFTETTVLEECARFRREHKHIEGGNPLVAQEIGTMRVSLFAGDPDRTDMQFCLEAVGLGLLCRPSFDFKVCGPDEQPEVFDTIDDAQKIRRKAEYAYAVLGVPTEIRVKVRTVQTFIGTWSPHAVTESHDG